MIQDSDRLADWLDREASDFAVCPTGVVSRLDMAHLLLKLATALRDINLEKERGTSE